MLLRGCRGNRDSGWRRTGAALAILCAAHACLLGWGAFRQSPTVDEAAHLAAGMLLWKSGRTDLYCVNPPLVRAVAAIPAVLSGIAPPPTEHGSEIVDPCHRPEFAIGRVWFNSLGAEAFHCLVQGRWACIPFSLLGAWYCYRWAHLLFGARSGLAAATMWCFSPGILGHAELITPDVPAAAMGLAAGFHFRNWLLRPSWSRAAIAGICVALALLAKLTWILLFLLWPAIWLTRRIQLLRRENVPGAPKTTAAEAFQLAFILATAVYCLNIGYGFRGALQPLGQFRFCSRLLKGTDQINRFRNSTLAGIAVPLPADFVRGLDVQKAEFETGRPGYLRGRWRDGGWYHYYLYAAAVKTPLAIWLLAAIALAVAARRNLRPAVDGVEYAVLLGPALSVLALVSLQTGINQHARYMIPAAPFLFVALSIAFVRHRRLPAKVGAGLMAWAVCSSLAVYPHTMSYFNEAAGGPHNGHRHLLHSNIDWGQDLLFLRDWWHESSADGRLHLAWYGSIDPRVLGINFVPVAPRQPASPTSTASSRAGWYAISVNVLHDPRESVPDGRGARTWVPEEYAEYFRRRRPDFKAGYSIFVYRVAHDSPTRLPETRNAPRKE